MKILYALLLVILQFGFSSIVIAQSPHIPNGSFENLKQCPHGASQIDTAIGWLSFTNGTPDLFNACARYNSTIHVPRNSFGYQPAADGDGYVGIINDFGRNYHEYIAAEMIPLTPGKVYEVSMSVSLADYCLYGSNSLGVYFYKSGPSHIATTGILNLTPQVRFTNFGTVTDTQNWVRLATTYTPDSAYTNIVIGSFMPTNLKLDTLRPQGPYGYYYIDLVSVGPSDGADTTLTSVSLTNTFKDVKAYPNPTSGEFTLSGVVKQTSGTITAEVLNMVGQSIYHSEIEIHNHKLHHEVVLPSVAAGNYMLRLEDEEGRVVVYKLNVR